MSHTFTLHELYKLWVSWSKLISYDTQGFTETYLNLIIYLVKAYEVLIVDSHLEELRLTPLKVAYMKGQKDLEGREPSKLGIMRTCGSLFYWNSLCIGSVGLVVFVLVACEHAFILGTFCGWQSKLPCLWGCLSTCRNL